MSDSHILLGLAIFRPWSKPRGVVGGDGRHDLNRAVHDRFSAEGHDLAYRLTDSGRARLAELGVRLSAGIDGAVPLRYCVDWTEQQHHLSGVVGRALAGRLLDLDWLRRAPRGRAVRLTDTGRNGLVDAGLLRGADEFAGAHQS